MKKEGIHRKQDWKAIRYKLHFKILAIQTIQLTMSTKIYKSKIVSKFQSTKKKE